MDYLIKAWFEIIYQMIALLYICKALDTIRFHYLNFEFCFFKNISKPGYSMAIFLQKYSQNTLHGVPARVSILQVQNLIYILLLFQPGHKYYHV